MLEERRDHERPRADEGVEHLSKHSGSGASRSCGRAGEKDQDADREEGHEDQRGIVEHRGHGVNLAGAPGWSQNESPGSCPESGGSDGAGDAGGRDPNA